MTFKDDLINIKKKYDIKVLNTRDLAKYLNKTTDQIKTLIQYNKIPAIKRGLYLLDENMGEFNISFELDKSSYISLDTALYYYGLIPELVRPVYCVTIKKTNNFEFNGINYFYRHIDTKLNFGYEIIGDFDYKIATREKALLDYLYFSKISVSKNIVNTVNKNYFKTEGVKKVINWLKEERFQRIDELNIEKLLEFSLKYNEKVVILTKVLLYIKEEL